MCESNGQLVEGVCSFSVWQLVHKLVNKWTYMHSLHDNYYVLFKAGVGVFYQI